MSNRTHIVEGGIEPNTLNPANVTLQEFSRRLFELMLERRWTQSMLAAASGVSRDGISGYIRGNHMPTPRKLKMLADALNVKPEDLLPSVVTSAIDKDTPSLNLKVSTSDPSRSWLQVNRLVRTKTAGEIIMMLNDDAEALAEQEPKVKTKGRAK